VAVAVGYDGRAAGAAGCWIVLAERDRDLNIIEVKAVKVGTRPNGKTGTLVKAGTYYALRGGLVVEA
jgi:hypothetical protein